MKCLTVVRSQGVARTDVDMRSGDERGRISAGVRIMWQIKRFKTQNAQRAWLQRNYQRIEWREIFVNNAYAIEYRKLRRVY
jgi:hypothetical protein